MSASFDVVYRLCYLMRLLTYVFYVSCVNRARCVIWSFLIFFVHLLCVLCCVCILLLSALLLHVVCFMYRCVLCVYVLLVRSRCLIFYLLVIVDLFVFMNCVCISR